MHLPLFEDKLVVDMAQRSPAGAPRHSEAAASSLSFSSFSSVGDCYFSISTPVACDDDDDVDES
jgi:hypothetical protein